VEPTGAGDTFAGGLMGYLAASDGPVDEALLRRAMAHGTALASFNVEGFGSERIYGLDRAEVDARVAELEAMTRF
jgi:sugar/nucleoside kinase (ribokinase family)